MIPSHFKTERLLSRIRAEFPLLKWNCHRLIWTGSGTHGGDHAMLLLDNAWIFRFPAPDMLDEFHTEVAVCNELRKDIKLYVPNYELMAKDGSFAGCRPINGIRLTPARFRQLGRAHQQRMARDTAEFLNTIHAFPVSRAEQLGAGTIGTDLTDVHATGLRKEFEKVASSLDPAVVVTVRAITDWLIFQKNLHGEMVLTHGDVWHKHIFFELAGKTLAGVIDWAPTIRDQAMDFFGLWAYGEEFVDAVIADYSFSYPGLKKQSQIVFYDVFIGCLIAGVSGIYNGTVKRYSENLVRDWIEQGIVRELEK